MNLLSRFAPIDKRLSEIFSIVNNKNNYFKNNSYNYIIIRKINDNTNFLSIRYLNIIKEINSKNLKYKIE